MILSGMDTPKVASSVQSSASNILFKKSPISVDYARTVSAWSQQIEVICCYGSPSKLGVDWPNYISSKHMHQSDQAINSLMLIRYCFKTYP